MSSSSSTSPTGQPAQGLWSTAASYLYPPVAAGVAIVPTYYGFVAKNALQLGRPIPQMNAELFKGALKAAPALSVAVGAQMGAQKIVERMFVDKPEDSAESSHNSVKMMLLSSTLVGGLSAYPLAVFNNQVGGKSFKESIKSPSAKVLVAMAGREACFLSSLRVSGPVSEVMKSAFDDNEVVEQGAIFATGAVGSLVGHPADTAATLWQNGMKVANFRQLAKGSATKAFAVGAFSVAYKAVERGLRSLSE